MQCVDVVHVEQSVPCVCLSVTFEMTFNLDMACWFTLTMSSKVKIIGENKSSATADMPTMAQRKSKICSVEKQT